MARAKTAKTLLARFLPVIAFLSVCAAVPNAVWADVTSGGSVDGNATVGDTAFGWVSVFQGPASPTLITSANLIIANHTAASGSWVHIDGTGSGWMCPSNGPLTICSGLATNASASMTISNGGTFTGGGGATLGAGNNSTGTLTVGGVSTNGIPATMNLVGAMTVGSGGGSTGNLNITAGGIVNNTDGLIGATGGPTTNSNGNVTVDGLGSQWNNIGSLSLGRNSASFQGILTITNGAAVIVGDTTSINQSSPNSIIYFGNGGMLVTKYLNAAPSQIVGLDTVTSQIVGLTGPGSGTLTVRGYVGDTTITFDAAHGPIQTYPGFSSGGNVAVLLNVSDPSNVADLGLGNASTGSLIIKDGVTVYAANGWLGVQAGSVGNGTVTGAGSAWSNSGTLYIGNGGSGTLNITNGGTVAVNAVIGGNSATGVGTLNFDGGILKPYNAGNSAWITTGSGSGNVYIKEGGATFDTGNYAMGIGVALQHGGSNPIDGGLTKLGAGTLTLTGVNTYTGPTTVNGGVLELGRNAQNAVLGGGANIVSGALLFDYPGGATLTDIERLLVAHLTVPSHTPPLVYLPNSSIQPLVMLPDDSVLNMTVESTLPGDANLDGTVNLSDLGVLIGNFGKSGGWATGDFNYDGTVNLSDLGVLIGNFGKSAPVYSLVVAGMDVSIVPEPSTLVLLAAGLIGPLAYAWRKRK
jgi:T5SS/PEP-CTERM-associated repeat protein/autotransporter-associated beta strand protein